MRGIGQTCCCLDRCLEMKLNEVARAEKEAAATAARRERAEAQAERSREFARKQEAKRKRYHLPFPPFLFTVASCCSY